MIIETALSAAGFLIILGTSLVMNTPKGYMPLNGETENYESAQKLRKLSVFTTILGSIGLFIIAALLLHSDLEQVTLWAPYILDGSILVSPFN